jgi:glutathione S-transferase
MTLTLHSHPFASFCQKVLVALYENDTPFTQHLVDLGDPAARAAFLALWPVGKMPVLADAGRDRIVPESSIIIDYLDQYFLGPTRFIPADPDLARQTRLADRFYDQQVQEPMQKIVADRLRPADHKDPFGVEAARAQLRNAYGMIEQDMAAKTWAMGEAFTLADCAAAPALFYADKVEPFGETHPNTAAYLGRLKARPSFARVVAEAAPFMPLFPQ